MALENAESLSDPFALSDPHGAGAGLHSAAHQLNTQFESGIPPARQRDESASATLFSSELTLEDGLQRLEAALANVVRTEANLGSLMRGLKHLAAGAEAARTANTELMPRARRTARPPQPQQEEEHALRFRTSQLEQLLNVIRHETSSEREFLIEQQDLFLVEILNDHERQLSDLRQRLRESSQDKVELQKFQELIAQRDSGSRVRHALRARTRLGLARAGRGSRGGPSGTDPTQPVRRRRDWLD